MTDATAFAGEHLVRWIEIPGDGSPVLYLHGLGCHGAASWAATAVALGRPGIIVDLPGHGRSDAPGDFGYTLPEVADAVARVIEHEGGPLDVAGHSLGGSVAVFLAHRHPDLVRRAVLVEPAIDVAPRSPGDIADVEEAALSGDGWRELLAREAPWRRADVKLTDPIALVRSARALGDAYAHTLHDLLVTMPAPTTLVHGDLREYADLDGIRASGVHDIRVRGTQHFVMLDDPAAFDAILREALA